jgi:hypothetical protein
MPNKDYEIKLVNWTKFREQLEVSLNPFQDVIDYYNKIPRSKLGVDPWDQSTWPTPWELLAQNSICDLTNSLGVCYTLQLTNRFSRSEFEIHIVMDYSNEELCYPVCINNSVLCYKYNEVVQKTELPTHFVSQRIYKMPTLQ